MIAAIRTFLVRVLLKIAWSVGGHSDDVDGLPRLTRASLQPMLALLAPGDLVLLGNNGNLSHIAVHVGDQIIVHAMATEKTMRGWLGSLRDALDRLIGKPEAFVGVLREPLVDFIERYERDTWLLVRPDGLDPESAARGVARIEGLIGKPYDYGFQIDNESWYCTEIAVAFLEAATGKRPELATRRVRVPMLIDEPVIEPVAVIGAPGLTVVGANEAAKHRYADHLAGIALA